MLYTREASGSVEEVARRLERAAFGLQFSVLAEHDLQARLRAKGLELAHACRILEVCNPVQAREVLERDMAISTALPCRISVYEEEERVRVATLLPTRLLALFGAPGLDPVAKQIEESIVRMIDAACS